MGCKNSLLHAVGEQSGHDLCCSIHQEPVSDSLRLLFNQIELRRDDQEAGSDGTFAGTQSQPQDEERRKRGAGGVEHEEDAEEEDVVGEDASNWEALHHERLRDDEDQIGDVEGGSCIDVWRKGQR